MHNAPFEQQDEVALVGTDVVVSDAVVSGSAQIRLQTDALHDANKPTAAPLILPSLKLAVVKEAKEYGSRTSSYSPYLDYNMGSIKNSSIRWNRAD